MNSSHNPLLPKSVVYNMDGLRTGRGELIYPSSGGATASSLAMHIQTLGPRRAESMGNMDRETTILPTPKLILISAGQSLRISRVISVTIFDFRRGSSSNLR